jgi:bifunctional DNA-binding transcriptional regulator/antitoxin component of YhaV-PrlF toxin-antitoxin module
MSAVVKVLPSRRVRGASRVSSKNQVTLPVDVMRAAGIEAGDLLFARVIGPGAIALERPETTLESIAGSLTGIYQGFSIDELRNEWN